MRQNKMILKAILEHFNLDPEVHCNRPEIPVQKKRKRNVKTRETLIGNDSEEEEDIADRLNNSMKKIIQREMERKKKTKIAYRIKSRTGGC